MVTLEATTLGEAQNVHAFEVTYMARRGRTFQWQGETIEEVSNTISPGRGHARRVAEPSARAKLGFQNGLLLFIICSAIMLFAVPALIVVLSVIYAVIFGK